METDVRNSPSSSGASRASVLGLLREVSRSFYLTLRVLPRAVRDQIGLAYLLARTSDTVADTEIVAAEKRIDALHALLETILGLTALPLNFGELAVNQSSSAERKLLERATESIALLSTFDPRDQAEIRALLTVIDGGQELDLKRFAGADAKNLVALAADADLDDYTYRVAGCVGEFWTRLCRRHLFPRAQVDESFLVTRGVCFGKGLQLVNILRDLPRDLRQGRCYLPTDKLAEVKLAPRDLLDTGSEAKLRPLYNYYLDRADSHLAAGWDYTNALPRNQFRVRLACAWPVLIGVRTTRQLRSNRILDPAQKIKVSRGEIRAIMARSVLVWPFEKLWQAQFLRARDQGANAVDSGQGFH